MEGEHKFKHDLSLLAEIYSDLITNKQGKVCKLYMVSIVFVVVA